MKKSKPDLNILLEKAFILRFYPEISIPLTKKFLFLIKRRVMRLKKLKAFFCKKCSYLMVPVDTCDCFVEERKGFRLIIDCLYCKNRNEYYLGNKKV